MSREQSDKSIGARLRAVRLVRGMSQQDLSDAAGISLRAYQNYERGDRAITKDFILTLKESYGVDVVWLLTGEPSSFVAAQEPDHWRVFFGDDSAISDDLKAFGGRVRKAREDRGLSLEDVQAKTGISLKTLSRVERGERWPPSERLDEFASTLAEDGDIANLCHGLKWAFSSPVKRIKWFGVLSALTFNAGGTAHVFFQTDDVLKILEAMREFDSQRTDPDPKLQEFVEYFRKRYRYPEDEEFEDDIREQIHFLAEVPIAAQGVKLSPIWPRSSITEAERKAFVAKFEAEDPALHVFRGPDAGPITDDNDK